MTRLIILGIILLLSGAFFSNTISGTKTPSKTTANSTRTVQTMQPVVPDEQKTIDETEADPSATPHFISYQNTQYGFSFLLPGSWEGYTIVNDKWLGNAVGAAKTVETGPQITIRHPEWTSENPRQDIPILIFTMRQWDLLQQEQFHIGAAPIGPRELGRNNRYVFALPARYNFAFPAGYEEVETILKGKPLQPLSFEE